MPLWSWGANSHSQLGLGFDSEQVDTPTEVVLPDLHTNVIQMACGGGHTLMIDENRALFSCGWNTNCQLGIGPGNDENKFLRVWPLSGIIFTNIACGWDFSCGVTDTNLLIVWGSNKYGQLGLPKGQFPENVKPTRLQVNACSVSMGLRHTAIINSKGEVWVTGCGKHGQLGLGREILSSDRFQKVPNLKDISHIACGQNHTIAWSTVEKALYVWGDNKDGQLLIQYLDEKFFKIYNPQKIDIDVKQGVKKLLSGWKNVLLWLEDDTLLGWGRNNYHQLGIEAPFVGKPIKVQLPDGRRVKNVALGSEHTICLATDNTLWAWGWNEHANTGTGSNAFVIEKPTLVCTDMFIAKITQIYAGAAQNFIVTDNANETDTTATNKGILI